MERHLKTTKSKEYEDFLDKHAPEASNLCEENVAIKTLAFTDGQPYTGNASGDKNYSSPTHILSSGKSMFVEYGKDFRLTDEGLAEVRKIAPGFENIPTDLIGLRPFTDDEGNTVFVGGLEPYAEGLRIKRSKTYSANYKYVSPSGVKEGASSFLWYISDSKNGEYKPLNNRRDREIPITEDLKGKYLKVAVKIRDRNMIYSDDVFSAPVKVL